MPLIQLFSFYSSEVELKNSGLCVYAISKQLNFEFDPHIDKTRNFDKKSKILKNIIQLY